MHATGKRVRGVDDYFVSWGDAGGYLDGIAEVLTNGDRHQLDVVVADDADAKAFGAEEQGVRRNRDGAIGGGKVEVDEHEGSGAEEAFGVVEIYFDSEGACRLIDGVGVANDATADLQVGVGVLGQGGLITIMNGVGVDFGDGDIDAQAVGRVQVKQFAGIAGTGSGINEVTDVGVARRDDAIEWSDDAFVALELLEATNICAAGIDCSLVREISGNGAVNLFKLEQFKILADCFRRFAAVECVHDRIQRDSGTRNVVVAIPLFDVFLRHAFPIVLPFSELRR